MKTTISLSPQLYHQLMAKARDFGMSVTEYIKNLVVTDVKEKKKQLPMVDEETNKRIGKSLKAIKEGKYIILKSEEEIDKYFDNLNK